MKKISFFDTLLILLILAILGLSILLFLLLRKSAPNPTNTPLFIPTATLSGTVNEIKGNSIYFIPEAQSLLLLDKDGSSPTKIYEVKLNKNAVITKISFSIPYISAERKTDTITKNIVFKDILPNDFVTIETTTDLTKYSNGSITAGSITVYSNPFFIPGRIESIQDDSIEVVSPPAAENPTEEVIKTLNIKSLRILISPKTEISFTSATESGIITKSELAVKDIVFIHSLDNPDVDKTITAETINVQRTLP